MSITVYAHIERSTEVGVDKRSGNTGDYVVLEACGLALFINSREKLLEVASMLESAAKKWDDEKLLDKEQ